MSNLQIPREFIQLVLTRTELVDLIDNRVPLRKKSSNNYFACCPFHTEKSASFSVCQNKQFYYCFGCGAHGNAIDFLMQYDRLSFPEAIEALAKQAGMEVPRTVNAAPQSLISPDIYELLATITKFYQTELRKSEDAIDYLKQRGVSGLIARDFCIGYAPKSWDYLLQTFGKKPNERQQLLDAGMLIKKEDGGYYDRFRERIMFPIHDRRGRVIGFGGRIFDKGEPKYLNSPETPVFQKGHELYGLYQVLQAHRQLQRALIVEGYMDVIALFQHGITYAVATLGTATTAHHLQNLFRYTTEIIFCFDGDEAGRMAAWRALQITLPTLRNDTQVRFMFLPEGEDPDTLIRKEGKTGFEQRMQAALTLSSFFFQSISMQADLSSMDGRARFVNIATEHLKHLPSGILQDMMFEELAKKAHIDVTHLKKPQGTSYKKTVHPKARSPSLVRLAMILLVQEPQLASNIKEDLPALDIPGAALFTELVENIKQYSFPNTGTLLEYWRDRKERKLLEKLAHIEHMIPVAGIQHEFLGTLEQLRKLAYKQQIKQLLAKAGQNNLSFEEKNLLHALIHNKKE
ncbi:MAG: dnaG 1 [Gammaproteobacteria bacterium]|jgi:DNA primase|nr:dnaG 1 [Gammaproteobacteria bacterium]